MHALGTTVRPVARRSHAGGAKKRPTRYAGGATPPRLAEALRVHKRGEHLAAATAYAEVLAHDPECADAAMNLATALVSLGRARDAERAFEAALRLIPRDPRAHRDAGIGLAAVGAFEGAQRALGRAIELDPRAIGARLSLPRVFLSLGENEAALAHARAAVELAPGDASAWLELYRASFDDRALGEWIDCARRAVSLDPEHPHAPLFLAGALALAGEQQAAEVALEAAGIRVARHALDALGYALEHRTASTRFFAHKRELLLHALAQAPTEGVIVELGVRHGVSTRWLAEAAPQSTVHGFDAFEGLPEPWQGKARGLFATAGELPEVPANVSLHPGWFADTLPRFVAELGEPVRLLHVDSDLFASAKLGLECFGAHLAPGAVIVFDEYLGHANWRDDEHLAFTLWLRREVRRYEYLALSFVTGQAAVRLA
jgi:tetratricopeptide (TPR) repeat protein